MFHVSPHLSKFFKSHTDKVIPKVIILYISTACTVFLFYSRVIFSTLILLSFSCLQIIKL